MRRNYEVALQDVLDAISNVAEFVGSKTRDEFSNDKKTLHAVLRNLEVIGEAIKSIPAEVRRRHADVPWKRIGGLRDVLIHQYFGIDVDIVWNIVENKLPELRQQVETILSQADDSRDD